LNAETAETAETAVAPLCGRAPNRFQLCVLSVLCVECRDGSSFSCLRVFVVVFLRVLCDLCVDRFGAAGMLQVTNLSKEYPTPRGPLPVLSDVSFSLAPGEAAAIMGPSGSGKSSLLYALGALEPPTSGTVTLDGRDPFRLAPDELAAFRNTSVGFVFQDHCLLPQCTVLENVLIPTLVAPRSVSEKGEHAPSRPVPPAKNGQNSYGRAARSALLGARRALLGRAPSCRIAGRKVRRVALILPETFLQSCNPAIPISYRYGASRHCLADRFRPPGSLRRDDEGRDAGDLPGRDAG
jgi:hypothetical protein